MRFVVAISILSGCTNADLIPIDRQELLERQRLEAEVCAPAAAEKDLPYKILFAIDTSLSNAWNDPDANRELAVRSAITALIPQQTVSFGIITFSDEPRRQTFGFTRDLEILDGAIENIGSAQGGTNYSDTLWAVIDFITDDLDTLSVFEAARTHYLVFWLSDGFPTVGVSDPTALLPAVEYLVEQVENRVAEIQFNTAFLGAGGEDSADQIEAATTLLQEMAGLGSGEFTSIPAGEQFEFEIHLDDLVQHFELAFAIATNTHALLTADGLAADSDGDGILDALELEFGSDPASADTDGDGCRDGVERAAGLDPTICDCTCESSTDSDGDGLYDCEEDVLGTLPLNPDSDEDLVIDGIEVALGTSPLHSDDNRDTDLDEIPNHDELRFHLRPTMPTSAEELAKWGYRYEVTEIVRECDDCYQAPPCYAIHVENMAMVETLETDTHPEGGNLLELVVAFRSGGVSHFVHTVVQGQALPSYDYWDPPHGRFVAPIESFEPLEGTTEEIPEDKPEDLIEHSEIQTPIAPGSDPMVGGCAATRSGSFTILLCWILFRRRTTHSTTLRPRR